MPVPPDRGRRRASYSARRAAGQIAADQATLNSIAERLGPHSPAAGCCRTGRGGETRCRCADTWTGRGRQALCLFVFTRIAQEQGLAGRRLVGQGQAIGRAFRWCRPDPRRLILQHGARRDIDKHDRRLRHIGNFIELDRPEAQHRQDKGMKRHRTRDQRRLVPPLGQPSSNDLPRAHPSPEPCSQTGGGVSMAVLRRPCQPPTAATLRDLTKPAPRRRSRALSRCPVRRASGS